MFNGITGYFIKHGLKVIPEPTSPDVFYCVDDGGIEVETGELIYGFVRRLKPEAVLSTGIYTGISDLYIAQALKENGIGCLTALEFEKFHISRAKDLWNKMGVAQYITAVLTLSLEYKPDKRYQMIFLDTEPQIRFQELVKFYPFLDEGGFIFIHDAPRNLTQGNINPDHPEIRSWPFGDVPEDMKKILKSMSMFNFGSARGLVGFYKFHKDDYGYKSNS
jgi:predicted O-methyltransferase YrrM